MPIRERRLAVATTMMLVTVAIIPGTAPTVARAAGPQTTVNLRIEGASSTIFEGTVPTQGHAVTTQSGGTHHCDGTNNNAHPTPGPTATSALDDAARLHSFTFDGTFAQQYDDFFIQQIANSANTSSQFWALVINYSYAPVPGCQAVVQAGNEVLWAFDAISKEQLLKLTGPATAPMGKPITVRVTDGSTGGPVQGATVGGKTTDAQGNAQITFTTRGDHALKAEHPNSIRSNSVHVNVT
jgi:hypothetical protein